MTKLCSTCKVEKELSEFHRNRRKSDGLSDTCKACAIARATRHYSANKEARLAYIASWRERNKGKVNVYTARYRTKNGPECSARSRECHAAALNAVPAWIDRDTVIDFYREAEYQGMEVDHIVPLNADTVCGLHWEVNLQLLTKSENSSKQNRFWPDMWGTMI